MTEHIRIERGADFTHQRAIAPTQHEQEPALRRRHPVVPRPRRDAALHAPVGDTEQEDQPAVRFRSRIISHAKYLP